MLIGCQDTVGASGGDPTLANWLGQLQEASFGQAGPAMRKAYPPTRRMNGFSRAARRRGDDSENQEHSLFIPRAAQPPRPGGCCPGRILRGAPDDARAASAWRRPSSTQPGISASSAPAARHSSAACRISGSSRPPPLAPSNVPAASASRSARPAASSRSAATAAAFPFAVSSPRDT
jgi:hypothetical protein